jgi:transcription elongation factor GreA
MVEIPKGKFAVTVHGADRLRAELDELERRRGTVAGNIRTAKSYGDLSENFEYHEAKREQGMVEGRLAQLRQILPDLYVVAPEQVSLDRVGFGAVVSLREESGDTWDLTLVGPLEADPLEDRISFESPLGSALLGRGVGEVVQAQAPAGVVRYEIVGIRAYQP